ncbi:hypothetical protein J2I47_09850 [Fibrella sp. HMF5335]|uniref:ABC-2 family transporter protein n=1 Tax=Fibrella rubiginis TaxID=2817060 RepID=A0A939GHG0_9BACT|nr:hypothetical protein [Fibrella rubiginis]MBO0936846.1 hypothetical protein [Fibrella rubiginis]
MNQTFSLTRLARLNSWFWAIKGRTYLVAAGGILILICCMLSGVLFYGKDVNLDIQRNNVVWFNFLAVAVVAIISSDVFSPVFRQESAISYLMIPASRTEKYTLGVGYCLLALLLLTVGYFSYEAIVFSIANKRLPANTTNRYISSIRYAATRTDFSLLLAMAYAFLLAMAIGLLGSFYFRRGVLARNIGVALGVLLGISFLNYGIIKLFFMDVDLSAPVLFLPASVSWSSGSVQLTTPQWLFYGAYGLILIALWLIGRIRFNELER